MGKLIRKVLIILGIILLVGVGAVAYLYNDYRSSIKQSYNPNNGYVEIIIEEGETTAEIAESLEKNELIKNKYYFQFYIRQENLETNLQAGQYRIPLNSTTEEIAEYLQNAEVPDIRVTIPESLMIIEIADILEEAFEVNPETSFDKQEFIKLTENADIARDLGIPVPEGKDLEGYIFPDTYEFPSDANAEYVLNGILNIGFKQKIYNKYKEEIQESQFSLYEILNLASMLERETKFPEDRPKVADILIRRLENNWTLGIDATILYYHKDWTHEITEQDLNMDSPYNTRKNPGLPPTPICNPGEETIRAVLYPEPNEYWYYISDEDFVLHYAVTEAEHNANIREYLW